MRHSYTFTLLMICALLFTGARCYAGQEITLIYTGQTHAAVYPCQCPIEPDGGIARRAAKIKELRRADPLAIVVDSGSFFAGAVMDENSQNTELDKERTLITLKSLKLMGYDALGVADDEFNFTSQFLSEQLDKTAIPFLSCNIKGIKTLPFITREIKGIKIGIVGVTTPMARNKAADLEIAPARESVKSTVESLKKNGVDIVILLSSLSGEENNDLITNIPGIDIVIGNFTIAEKELYFKKGSSLIFKPVFEGRRLGKAVLFIENKKIKEVDLEEIRLSSEVKEDKDVLAILPRCFSDYECKKDDLAGSCQNAGKADAACLYAEANPVSLSVIEPPECKGCNTKNLIAALKKKFPGLKVVYLEYPGVKSKKLIEELRIQTLPAYILGKEADAEKEFSSIKSSVDFNGSSYLIKPVLGGVALYLNRERAEGKFDLFVSLFDKDTAKLLGIAREFAPQVHFLAAGSIGGFEARGGIAEVEECLRGVCVQKYYPQSFWDYIICRAGRSSSTWWEDCLPVNINTEAISKCARSKEGADLLEKNISLNKELQLLYGPAYLVNNQEIYGGKGVPARAELKAIIKR
jgi:hypothetical protein